MPATSPAQERLMQAAAHTKGGYDGVPQAVGKEFTKSDNDLEWLDELVQNEMLAKSLKGDAIPEEPTVLSTPSNIVVHKGTLSKELQKIQLKDIGEKLYQVAQHIESLKKGDGEELKNDNIEEPIELAPEEPAVVEPVDKDAGPNGRCAGIMFVTADEEVLLIRRGNGGDYPGTWAVPGGHQDEKDKDLEDCARRECFEETGLKYEGKLEVLFDDGQFRTYIARNVDKGDVKLNHESTGYDWCNSSNPPTPLHPGMEIAFKVAKAKTETDIALLVSQDILTSPQIYANVALLAIRITGTGLAFRSSLGEHVWRDSSLYLNEEFLQRCNGLAVIMDHPAGIALTTEEYKKRNIGSIMYAYIKGDEVWGIAKIYVQEALDEILEGDISTSPAVVFNETAGNITLQTENGQPLLIEGVPFLLDHIAIVTKARGSKGVWDKGGEPAGVLLTNNEVSENE